MANYTQSVSDVNILEYAGYDSIDENMIVSCAFAYICGNEVNNFVTNSYFEEYKIDGELTSTSDPVSAAKCLSDTLATNMKLNVKRVAIEYCMIKKVILRKAQEMKKQTVKKLPGQLTARMTYMKLFHAGCFTLTKLRTRKFMQP